MIINVENTTKMIEDICTFLDIVPEYLEERIKEISDVAAAEEDYSKAFLKLSEEFISENTSSKLSDVWFCHLTRSIGQPRELLPLKTLLTSENAFSDFLKCHSIEFQADNDMLLMFCNGNLIPGIKLYDPTKWDNEHTRLAGRLGYLGVKDFCVNGFLHAIEPEKSTDGYYGNLIDGPELLQDLDAFFHTNLCEEYCKRSKYYYAIAKVPLSDIIFDERSDLNYEGDRTNAYLSLCFEFLLSWYTQQRWSSILHNEKFRINDYSTVTIDHYIELV